MKTFSSIIILIFINCTKPQDYCDEAHKYYDFDLKKAMTSQECFLYNREKSKPIFCPE